MNSSSTRVVATVSLVLIAIWAGARWHLSHRAPVHATSVAVPAGESSPPLPSDLLPTEETTSPPQIPDRLPSFALADRDGKRVSITAWQGRSLVINFWATWCAPCRREIPLLQDLGAEWAARDVTVVGIAVDYRDKVQQFAEQFKIAYPLVIGEQDALDAAAAFGMTSPVFPFTVFTDRRAEVVALFVGELHKPQAALILAAVDDLNHERVPLAEARRVIAVGLSRLAPKPAG